MSLFVCKHPRWENNLGKFILYLSCNLKCLLKPNHQHTATSQKQLYVNFWERGSCSEAKGSLSVDKHRRPICFVWACCKKKTGKQVFSWLFTCMVNLIHIKLWRGVKKNLQRKVKLPPSKQQMTFQRLTFLLLRNQKKEHRREREKKNIFIKVAPCFWWHLFCARPLVDALLFEVIYAAFSQSLWFSASFHSDTGRGQEKGRSRLMAVWPTSIFTADQWCRPCWF